MNNLQQLDLDELEETLSNITDDSKHFVITDLNSLNWTLRKLTALSAQQAEAQGLADAELFRINSWLFAQKVAIQSSRDYLESLIAEYAAKEREVDPEWKSKKTIYGKIRYKKQQPEWKYENDVVIKWMQDNGHDDLLRVKYEPKKDEIKKAFQIVGVALFDAASGEVVEGIQVFEREDKLEIKEG